MTIEAYDTAVVSDTTFSNIRVEAADSMLINLALDVPPTWRTAADTCMYKDTYFTNVARTSRRSSASTGESRPSTSTAFTSKTSRSRAKPSTSQTDSDATWDINQYVSGITFQ